jgi:hypothetical protein
MKALAIFLIAFMPLTSFARIGEDYAEFVSRYGDAQRKYDGEYGVEYSLFKKSIYQIHAKLWNGNVHQIGYSKDTAFTDLEISYILKVNGGNDKWKRLDDTRWVNKNNALTAIREDGGLITIFTSKYGHHYWDSKRKEDEDKELANLEGL